MQPQQFPPFLIFGKKRAEFINLSFGQLVIVNIGGEHSRNIAVIKTVEKSIAFLSYILRFAHQWRIDKYTALLFIRENTFCHQAFYQSLYGFRAPRCRFY